jgi:hypothetical protein
MTMATMNMFQYYHYMTKFIEVLAEKHGYDAEVMQNEWRSLNAKWMAETVVSEPAVEPATDDDEEVTTCKVLLKSGPKKGKACGKKTVPGEETCKAHVPKDEVEKPTAAKKPAAKAAATREPASDNEEVTMCKVLLTRGPKKGKACGKKTAPGEETCKPHVPKSDEVETKKAVKKPAKKPVETESEEFASEVDEEEEEEIALEEFVKEIESEEFVKEIESESEKSDDNEDKPSTKIDIEDLVKAVIEKCSHTFKFGKNKGEKCPAEPVDGSDKCKKHTK